MVATIYMNSSHAKIRYTVILYQSSWYLGKKNGKTYSFRYAVCKGEGPLS